MAQSIEEIKAGLEAPTHNIVNGEQVDLTAEEIEATLNFWAENERAKQLDEEANGYKVARQSAYASIQDQLDMQYWDNVNGTTTWKDHIAQVKSDNPKPPIYIKTKLTKALREEDEEREKITKRTALKKWGVPKDIAGAAVYLASDRASYTTGTTITVDGGYSIT